MSSHVQCPSCGSRDGRKLFYTPQGGILWTPFLNFIKCRACGARFHGQTGQLDPQVPKAMRVITVLIILVFTGLFVGFAMSLSSLRRTKTSQPTAVPTITVPTPSRR
jgi:hypothetical protein